MRVFIVGLFCAVFLAGSAKAQDGFQSYHRQTDLLLSSPGSLRFGLNGFENPAMLSYIRNFDLSYSWTTQDTVNGDYNRWGAFAGFHNFGFGAMHERYNDAEVTDYRLSFAGGDKSFSTGISYGWSNGNRAAFNRASVWNIGFLVRPAEYVSIGLVGTQQVGGSGKQGVIDIAARPFGNEWLTLFADYSITNDQRLKEGNWSGGAVVEVLPGLRLAGRYFDTKTVTAGVQIGLGEIGFTSQSHIHENKDANYNTYTIRVGDRDRNLYKTIIPEEKYLKMEMKGPIAYQRYKLFDERITLYELLKGIDAARNDPEIKGIAINLSSLETNREFVWELRERLKEFRSAGKKVVAYIDRANIDLYQLASVCDNIVMDPIGMISLEGFIMGRTFMKNTLEKIGIGFDEWRFFTYKSAMESFSRESMSDGDREQRQAVIDDYYALAKKDICEGRSIDPGAFDEMVDNVVLFQATMALERGLVDTLGRWDAVEAVVKKLEDGSVPYTSVSTLDEFTRPYDAKWGEEPKIAIVYALGACAMDEGIKARSLSKVIQGIGKNPQIKAVVFRVDSPGGDGMASDIVAEALKECRKSKPVIISQGYVAASGGYWLSMYGDTIVAAPNTITGSIGVIGGWFYNKTLKDELGFTTDHVKKGKHADLGFGATMPLLGLTIPDRNLTPEEHAKMKEYIMYHYYDFAGKVASGRDMDTSKVLEIAQGRIWSGTDGASNGLVDVLGGMMDAVRIAKERAGIGKDEPVTIYQYPEPELFNLSGLFQPSLVGVNVMNDPLVRHLKFRLENNGIPMPMLPAEDWDATMLHLGFDLNN